MSSELMESAAAFFCSAVKAGWAAGALFLFVGVVVVHAAADRRSAAPSASAAKRRLFIVEVFLVWSKGKRLRVSPPRARVVKRPADPREEQLRRRARVGYNLRRPTRAAR